MAEMERPGLFAEQPSSVSETATTDSKTPAQALGGRFTGTLRSKYDKWVQRFARMVTGLGLDTWQEFDQCEYLDMDVDSIAGVLREEIVAAVEAEKKPPGELLASQMEAIRMAKAIRMIARERAGMPNSPSYSEGRPRSTADSGMTESQLTRDTAKLGMFSQLKSDERLELANGTSKPAHLSDVARYLDEQTKPFVGMPGYEPLAAVLEGRKERPDMTAQEFEHEFIATVPEDVGRHFARLCYGDIPQQYKKEVMSQSKYKKRLFDPGVMPFALYEISVNVSDLDTAQKRCAYLQPTPVKPNDKQMLEASYKRYEKDSFELFQLRELGTARTEPHEVQYRIGSALFCNYPDISHRWSQLWVAAETRNMTLIHTMMQEIAQLIKELPDYQPHRYPARPPGLTPVRKPGNYPETTDRCMCKDFQRTGKCEWETRTGRKCRFSHEPRKVMMAQVSDTEGEVIQLQHTMNDMNQ